MKRKSAFVAALIMLVVSACSKENDSVDTAPRSIIGTWKQVEYFMSPGDVGSWYPATGDLTFTVWGDSSYTVQGGQDFIGTQGKIVMQADTILYSKFSYPDNAMQVWPNLPRNIRFSERGDTLTIYSFLCIEGCASKFRKLKNYAL